MRLGYNVDGGVNPRLPSQNPGVPETTYGLPSVFFNGGYMTGDNGVYVCPEQDTVVNDPSSSTESEWSMADWGNTYAVTPLIDLSKPLDELIREAKIGNLTGVPWMSDNWFRLPGRADDPASTGGSISWSVRGQLIPHRPASAPYFDLAYWRSVTLPGKNLFDVKGTNNLRFDGSAYTKVDGI